MRIKIIIVCQKIIYVITMTSQVEIKTTMGSFFVELYSQHAPKTCNNFIELAKRGYYDGTIVSSFAILSLEAGLNSIFSFF